MGDRLAERFHFFLILILYLNRYLNLLAARGKDAVAVKIKD
jgi:hypothetical protein